MIRLRYHMCRACKPPRRTRHVSWDLTFDLKNGGKPVQGETRRCAGCGTYYGLGAGDA